MKYGAIILGLFIYLASAQGAQAQYDKYKALYIYNFTKRIDWPKDENNSDFIMGVLGKSEIVDHLKGFTQNKKVINQPIKVEQYLSEESMRDCDLLVITSRFKDLTPKLTEQFEKAPVLIITEEPGSEGDINFRETEKALLFEINPEQIRAKQLKVSQSLINLGIEIGNGT
ncbi:MAG: YfiR family protein [Bacteroidota bacterium]